MGKYIGRRLLQLIPIVFGVTFISFLLMLLAVTDTVDVLYEQQSGANAAAAAAKRAALGLDQGFFTQYCHWLWQVLHGDMGQSFVTSLPVSTTMLSKLPATLELMLLALFLTLLISLPLGTLAAIRKGSIWDQLARLLSFTGNALPDFLFALILLYFFAVKWHFFSFLTPTADRSPLLPALPLAFAMTAKYLRQIRALLLDELSKEYVQALLCRGLPYHYVLTHYVFRAVAAPLLALLALSAASLLGGSAIVETIFLWDGVGKLAVDAIMLRDYPIIQAYMIWMSALYVLFNLAADIICVYVDPRLTLRKKED
ncbi:ABC transporter permease [uncultured Megasphaera sp.]|uniref:ABC transporter permease n=1 Tax=uncultured Megasphaera sp. TaxID=165188 RepID=UPI002595C921|nr:ABC transporter permease [uncultured Megasphaera sp.]